MIYHKLRFLLDVITIKAQASPENASRYFSEHLSHDDYYSEKERTTGQWFGRTGEMLGIANGSEVEKEQFVSLCNGLRPDNQIRLTQRQTANRRCLYDFTASAPKSVSIMALIADDARLIAAHEKAVTAALEAAEKLAATRVRKGAAAGTRQHRQTGNVIAARFLHKESRALDPQLHTHCIVFNVTHDPVEQRLKALEARAFYDQSKQLTKVYRDHLKRSLRSLGYETYVDRQRCPQIKGVDKELIDTFSKRASQRDTLIALRETQLKRKLSKNEVAEIVHRNRAKKQRHVEPEAVRQFQLEQVQPRNRFDLERLKEQALGGPRPPVIRPAAPVLAPAANWIAVVRLALLASRTVNINPFIFSPDHSWPERACTAARFLRQVQRTQTYLRRARGLNANGISR